jgi:pimeloyl-ACP methyl ester carboxylesterase
MAVDPYETLDLDVPGGALRVGRWDKEAPVVMAAHGITGNHLSFQGVARALGDRAVLVAPDLRGRGGSRGLPGPFGMRAHADDLIAVMDHLGIDRAPIIGHSMGAYVATVAADRHPDRVSALVLVDGGIALPLPDGVDPDAMVAGVLGPALTRLEMTFETRDAYVRFWHEHPAFGDAAVWNEDTDAWLLADLTGEEPELQTAASLESVRYDGRELLVDREVRSAFNRIRCRAVLLRATRGLLDQVPPLLPDELLDPLRATWPLQLEMVVENTNHYTILLAARGASIIAAHAAAAASR